MSSGDFEIGWPDIGFKNSDQVMYQYLTKKESRTPFSGMLMSEVFIYAMSLGYKDGKRVPYAAKERFPNMPPNAFNSEMRWIMRSISITVEEDLEHVVEHSKVVKIAEEFANRGMEIIRELDIASGKSFQREAPYETHMKEIIRE